MAVEHCGGTDCKFTYTDAGFLHDNERPCRCVCHYCVRPFPLLITWREREGHPEWPRSVPWSMVAPHEAQALANHGGQTLEHLASRGGLGVRELLCVLDGEGLWKGRWRGGNTADDQEAVDELQRRIAAYFAVIRA